MHGNIRGRLFGGDTPPLPEIGPLVLRKQLGRGGMGVVFLADDRRLRREVAVKLISLERRPGAAAILEEARAIAAIDHENVVRVFSAGRCAVPGEDQPRVYIAMERIHGRTLRRWVTQDSPSATVIVEAFRQAARGLGAAHRVGITHGDFKPDNAMIDAHGWVRTMDFGLAVRREPTTDDGLGARESSRPFELAGSPGYLAPELLRGRAPDPRSDQWALCASLCEALVGVLPAGRPDGALAQRLAALPGFHRHQIAALRRGLSDDPAERFPSMEALHDALAPARRRRRLLAAAGAVGLALVAIVAWPTRATSCDGAALLAGTWGPERRAEVRHAVLASGVDAALSQPDAVLDAIDAYAADLSEQASATCASTAPVDRRAACLERGRRGLDALVRGLVAVDARGVANARDAVERLPSIASCDDESPWPMPQDPGLALAVERMRADLAGASSTAELGGGTAALIELWEQARALDHPPLLAEVELELARHEAVVGDAAQAAARLERVHATAVEYGMDALAARASIARAISEAQLGSVDVGRRWLRAAQAEASAANLDVAEHLLEVRFELAIASNLLDDAQAVAEQQRVDAEQRCPDGCAATVVALHELAQAAWLLGRAEEALQLATDGHVLAEQRLGPMHDSTLALVQLRADVLVELGEGERAADALAEVLAIRGATAAPSSASMLSTRFALAQAYRILPDREADAEAAYAQVIADATQVGNAHFVGMAEAELATMHHRRRDFASAIAADRRAIDQLVRAHGEEYPQLATLYNNHGIHLAAAGDPEAALAAAHRGWALWKAAMPEPSPQDAAFLANIGRQLIALGRPHEAIVPLERALAVTNGQPATVPGIRARAAMVDALAELGRPADASALLERTLARCAALPPDRARAASCDLLDATRIE